MMAASWDYFEMPSGARYVLASALVVAACSIAYDVDDLSSASGTDAGLGGADSTDGTASSDDGGVCGPRCKGDVPASCVNGKRAEGTAPCTTEQLCRDGQCVPGPDPGNSNPSCVAEIAGADKCLDKRCCGAVRIDGVGFEGIPLDNDDEIVEDVTLSSFYLDRYEVTVGRFRKFAAAYTVPAEGVGRHPNIPDSGWKASFNAFVPKSSDELGKWLNGDLDAVAGCTGTTGGTPATGATWTSAPGSNEALPMNCISWYLAFAFCAWDGGYLPTNTEWSYAAQNGRLATDYPWGNEPIATTNAAICDPTGKECTGILPVGSKSAGASKAGVFDLVGNVSEYTLDRFLSITARGAFGAEAPLVNPVVLSNDPAFQVALRGLSAGDNTLADPINPIAGTDPKTKSAAGGVRCAR